jgi:hypothetical protein
VALCTAVWLLLQAATLCAQDLEPRRWTHLPDGMNVFGIAVARTTGDLAFDPVLKVKNADVTSTTEVATYVKSFGLFGKSARVDLTVPYDENRWTGEVDGDPAKINRSGFADPRIRFSVNLLGAPLLKGKEFVEYKKEHPTNTVVGAAVAVKLPWGDYKKDKLLNIGKNRYAIRPQIGAVHTRGPWSYELTGSTFFFSDNNEFFGGNKLEQDPLYAVQAHVVRTLPDGWWVSVGAAYGWSGESKVNGERKSDRRGDLLSGLSFGFPIGANQGMKIAYIRSRTQRDVGSDTDTVLAGWTVAF